jgi:catechol 2,3-dioxygenase-like lactoylglutathione lyase family enzyme
VTTETTVEEVEARPEQLVTTIPGRPAMLSHVAYITHDTQATVEFYRDLLGMELVNAVLDDSIPSTGDPVPYFHSFFRMEDGSTVAFFEAPELPPQPAPSHPAYDVFQHLAMQVDSKETVDRWHAWLVQSGVEVLGPVDHKIIYSIYFHDPNGLRLEITAALDPTWNDRSDAAHVSLAEWQQAKATARESGRDMVSVLADLTRARSHRRAADPA